MIELFEHHPFLAFLASSMMALLLLNGIWNGSF